MSLHQTIPSSVGDIFNWQTSVTIPSNVAPNNEDHGRIQIDNASLFVLMAFLGSSNYDQVAGDFIAVVGAGPAAAVGLVTPPFHPSNFEVMIRYNDDIQLMGAPMPQACLCSNGYRTGPMLPYPMIFPPMTTFNFDFYNVAQTLQLEGDGSARDLVINFGLLGVFVPIEALSDFLAAWPTYGLEARKGIAGWLSKFTCLDIPAA